MLGQGILVWNVDAEEIFAVDELVCPDASMKFWAQRCWDVATCENWVIGGMIYSDGEESQTSSYQKPKKECGDTDKHRPHETKGRVVGTHLK